MTLLPAYGRDYKSKKAVLADFNNGLDFVMAATGQYCSIRDAAQFKNVSLRYNKHRSIVCLVKNNICKFVELKASR